jgi:hypothetical protein
MPRLVPRAHRSVNLSIGRYWEGRTAMETARIRWADACMCARTRSVPFAFALSHRTR